MSEVEFECELNKKLMDLIMLDNKDNLVDITINTITDYLDNSIEYNTYKEFITIIYNKLSNTKFIWDSIIKLNNIYLPYYDESKIHKTISKDDLFLFVYDFYKNNTNEYLFNIFESIFNDRLNNVNFFEDYEDNDINGSSLPLPYYHTNYINLYVSKSMGLEFIISLAHEYGHAIQDKINFQNKWEYFEIVSVFFELLCNEYYSDKVFGYEGLYLQLNDINNTLVNSDDFINLINIFNKLKLDKHNKQTKRNINKLSERYAKYIIKDNYSGFDNYQYIIGSIIATNLFMIYMEDKEKALYLLTKLINIDSNINVFGYYKELEKLGLSSSSGFARYRDYIVKKLD